MSDQFYVLMEKCFQYTDDNRYYYDQDYGSNPKKVFVFKTKANEVALQNNLNDFQRIIRDSSIKEYGYDLNDLISSKTLEDDLLFEEGIFMAVFGKPADEWWQSLRDLKWGQRLPLKIDPSPEQWQKLYNCFNLSFWEVVEVEGDCSSSQDTTLIIRSCGAQGGMICGYAPHDECWDCREYWKAREPASAETNL